MLLSLRIIVDLQRFMLNMVVDKNTFHSRVFHIFSILPMKDTLPNFQNLFFEYHIPIPFATIFTEDIVRNNDIRLLLQIATKSSLRMYTDSKTGNLHFICKQKGADCFDIEAEVHPLNYGYYFTYDYLKVRHVKKCEQEREAFEYLKIYNLMKLKKKLIEEYMIKLKVEKESPSIILNRLSNQSQVYFFEKYLNGHIEYKRKLRKRFDNIVNIDIKKIGKQEIDSEKEEKSKVSKKSKASRVKMMKQKLRMAKIKIDHKLQLEKMHIMTALQENQLSQNIIGKEKKISKKNHGKSQKPSIVLNTWCQQESEKKMKHQEIFQEQQSVIVKKEQILPQIMVLNEQAQFIWSQSDQDNSAQLPPSIQAVTSCEDYFKSLRNSALKRSLERQSLWHCFFSSESAKQNKQNIA